MLFSQDGRQLLSQFEKNYCLFNRLNELIDQNNHKFKLMHQVLSLRSINIDEYSSLIIFKAYSKLDNQVPLLSEPEEDANSERLLEFYDDAAPNLYTDLSLIANVDLDTKTCSVYSYMGSAMPMFPALTKKYRNLQIYEKIQCNQLLSELFHMLIRQAQPAKAQTRVSPFTSNA